MSPARPRSSTITSSPGLLHLKVLRSPHHHARIRRIDMSEAERMPGVRRIVRGADVPRNLNTLL